MTDRLTEIRARVAAAKADRLLNGPLVTFDDIEFVLGEIERLHDISAFNGLTEQVKALSAERDRLRTALELIAAAPGAIGETTLSKSGALFGSYKSEQIARAALEGSKS